MRILIADDQPNVRYALRVLFKQRPDLVLVGEAMDAFELQAMLSTTNPGMLIVDWMLPGLVEIGSIAELQRCKGSLIVIALSGRPELGREALKAGANAFVSKIDPPDKLLKTIDSFQDRTNRTHLVAKRG